MAKEANKTTVIALLVVAGILLFLVGSFTGQVFNFGPRTRQTGQLCTTYAKCASGLQCVNHKCQATQLIKNIFLNVGESYLIEDKFLNIHCGTVGPGVDLSKYPSGLGFGGSDTVIIIGANARDSASDNAAAVDIAAGLPVGEGVKILLDTELANSEYYNVILVGNPCDNYWTAKFMGYSTNNDPNCKNGFVNGEAVIELKANGDKYAIIAAGYSAIDTRRAGVVLKNYAIKLGSNVIHKSSVTVKGTSSDLSNLSNIIVS